MRLLKLGIVIFHIFLTLERVILYTILYYAGVLAIILLFRLSNIINSRHKINFLCHVFLTMHIWGTQISFLSVLSLLILAKTNHSPLRYFQIQNCNKAGLHTVTQQARTTWLQQWEWWRVCLSVQSLDFTLSRRIIISKTTDHRRRLNAMSRLRSHISKPTRTWKEGSELIRVVCALIGE